MLFGITRRTLALDLLESGDIILTGSATWKSLFIQIVTGSAFSHATLILHPLVWFESIPEGIQYKAVEPYVFAENAKLRCVTILPRNQWVKVLRPIENTLNSTSDPNTLFNALIEATYDHFQLEYPKREEFLNLVRLGLGKNKAIRWIARRIFGDEKIFFPGTFCSALVVQCYRNSNPEFFNASPSLTPTPGALSRCNAFKAIDASCALKENSHAIFQRLNNDAKHNTQITNSIISRWMEVSLAGRTGALIARTNIQLLDIAKMLSNDKETTRQIDDKLKVSKRRAQEIKRQFHKNRRRLNRIKSLMLPLLAWWSQFNVATECADSCKAGPSSSCEESGCRKAAVAYIDFFMNPSPSLHSFFSEQQNLMR